MIYRGSLEKLDKNKAPGRVGFIPKHLIKIHVPAQLSEGTNLLTLGFVARWILQYLYPDSHRQNKLGHVGQQGGRSQLPRNAWNCSSVRFEPSLRLKSTADQISGRIFSATPGLQFERLLQMPRPSRVILSSSDDPSTTNLLVRPNSSVPCRNRCLVSFVRFRGPL